MKKIVIVAIAILLMVSSSLVAAPKNKSNKDITIGFDTNLVTDFGAYVVKGAQDFANEVGIKIIIENANFNVNDQIQQCENLIAQGVDALVIKAQDKDACQPISTAVKEAGIPFVTINQPIKSANDVFVGSDETIAGQLEMEYLAKQMAGKGNVVILLGDPRELATHTRTNGIKNVIAKYPGIKVVSEQRGDWMRDKALAVTENWIQSGIKFDAVVALNDEMAIGALMAGEQSGVKFLVGGIDALPPALKLLKEGKISVTVFQDGYTQGYQGVKAAYELVTGKKVPSVIDVPFKLVPPEKADEFMALYK